MRSQEFIKVMAAKGPLICPEGFRQGDLRKIAPFLNRAPVFYCRDYHNDEQETESALRLLRSCGPLNPPYPLMWFEAGAGRDRIAVVSADHKDLIQFLVFHATDSGIPAVANPFGVLYRAADREAGFLFEDVWSDRLHYCALESDLPVPKANLHNLRCAITATLHCWALLDCSNVQVEDHIATGRCRRDHVTGEREPKLVYKTLVVKNSKGEIIADFGSDRRDLPLHTVRGHFKVYTEDKPLLGRHVGRFWFPAHVRGSSDHGAIIKDYDIRIRETSESTRST